MISVPEHAIGLPRFHRAGPSTSLDKKLSSVKLQANGEHHTMPGWIVKRQGGPANPYPNTRW